MRAAKGVKIVSFLSTFLGFEYCNDDFMSEEELKELEEEEADNPLWVLPTENIQVEDLTDHGMKGEDTLQGGQNCCHNIFFLGVPCLNYNHVIIIKDFHNVSAYYGRSKPK
jgi:hypothetical protein